MADSKITALTAISTVDPAADPLVIVDVSDTSMAASGTTKKATINQLLGASGTATLASATISGDLTVDTSTLKVDSANNRVGIGTASPTAGMALDIVSATSNNFVRFTDGVNATGYLGVRAANGAVYLHANNNIVSLSCSTSNTTPTEQLRITNPGVFEFLDGAGGTRMTLNSTGLGVGVSPATKFDVGLAGAGTPRIQLTSASDNPIYQTQRYTGVGSDYRGERLITGGGFYFQSAPAAPIGSQTFTTRMTLDDSGRLILLASTTTPATLNNNGELTFTATSNTNLRFSYRGSDGVTRVANITLA